MIIPVLQLGENEFPFRIFRPSEQIRTCGQRPPEYLAKLMFTPVKYPQTETRGGGSLRHSLSSALQ